MLRKFVGTWFGFRINDSVPEMIEIILREDGTFSATELWRGESVAGSYQYTPDSIELSRTDGQRIRLSYEAGRLLLEMSPDEIAVLKRSTADRKLPGLREMLDPMQIRAFRIGIQYCQRCNHTLVETLHVFAGFLDGYAEQLPWSQLLLSQDNLCRAICEAKPKGDPIVWVGQMHRSDSCNDALDNAIEKAIQGGHSTVPLQTLIAELFKGQSLTEERFLEAVPIPIDEFVSAFGAWNKDHPQS